MKQYSTVQKFVRSEITAHDLWHNLGSRWSPVIAACVEAEMSAQRRMAPLEARPASFVSDVSDLARLRLSTFENQVLELAAKNLGALYDHYWFRKDAHRLGLENPAGWAIASAEHAVFFKDEICPLRPSSAWARAFATGAELAEASRAVGDACAWKSVAERKFDPELLHQMAEENSGALQDLLVSVVRHVSDTIAVAPVDERPAMKLAASAIAYAAAEHFEYEALGDLVAGWEPTPDTDEAEQAPVPGL